jgi:hypothetical protein
MLTKTRTAIITLIASAGFAAAALAPTTAWLAPAPASASLMSRALGDGERAIKWTVVIGPITVCDANGNNCTVSPAPK